MSLVRHRRRTFLLCRETGMQKWARILVETGKAFVDPSAMTTQVREDTDFWSLSPLTILCWRTLLVITKHPEDGPDIAQLDNITTRLITFQWGSASNQEWTLPEHEVFQEQTLQVVTTCWWWPSAFAWKKSASQNTQDSSLTSKSERSQRVGKLSSYDRREVCTFHHHEQRRYRHRFNDHHLQHSSDWNSQWDPWQTSSEEKTLDHCRYSLSATKGGNWERKDLNLKDLRNTRKWTTTSRSAWKRQKKTG